MIDSTENRATRRRKAARVKTAAVAGAAVSAMALGLAGAPAAQALTVDVNWYPTYTSGVLADILNVVGNAFPGTDLQLSSTISYSSGPPQAVKLAVPIPGIGDVNLNLNLKNIDGDTKNLYNTVGGTPQQGGCTGSGFTPPASCRYIIQLATSQAVMNLIDAYRSQVSSVQGNTPAGLIPFTAAPTATAEKPSQTNQAFILLQNALRPNGGLAARFPEISKALGIDPVMPSAGKITSLDKKIALNTSTLDLTWAYDPIGDFPAVFNPTAIVNSVMAGLPLNLIDGLAEEPLQGDSLISIGLNLAGLLQFPGVPLIGTLPMTAGQAFYGTLVPNLMPILAPAALPGTLINFGLNALGSPFLLGNPFVDVLNPVMKILVNTGYTDVLSPTKLNTCAKDCYTATPKSWGDLGYTAYDRSFGANTAADNPANPRVATPFGSVDPLTPEEKKAVPGDAWNAFVSGVQAEIAKPFWGILVPNEAKSAATSAAAVPAPVKAAAATPVIESTPVAAPVAPVSAPAPVEAPAPAVQVSAPAADPAPVSAPVAEISLPANDPAPTPRPRAGAHRGAASAGSDNSGNSDAPKAAASTGHRGGN